MRGMIGQRHLGDIGTLHDVKVRHNVPVLIPDKARADTFWDLLHVETEQAVALRQVRDLNQGGRDLLVDVDVHFLRSGQVAARDDGSQLNLRIESGTPGPVPPDHEPGDGDQQYQDEHER